MDTHRLLRLATHGEHLPETRIPPTTQEKTAVMVAWVGEGGPARLECREVNGNSSGAWRPHPGCPAWNWEYLEYRMRP